jgi:Arc/MetJ-type ribon-helix-helix transcriptional regulator
LAYNVAMNITLTPDQEAWLKTEVAKGRFATPEEAIAHAINEARRASLCETLNTSIEGGGTNTAADVRRAIADRRNAAT